MQKTPNQVRDPITKDLRLRGRQKGMTLVIFEIPPKVSLAVIQFFRTLFNPNHLA